MAKIAYYCNKYKDRVAYPKALENCLIKACPYLARYNNKKHAKKQNLVHLA